MTARYGSVLTAGWTAPSGVPGAPGTRTDCTAGAVRRARARLSWLRRWSARPRPGTARRAGSPGPRGRAGSRLGSQGPAGPRPGRVLPSTSISAPTERSSRTPGRRPVGQLHLNPRRLRAEGLAHHRLQGGFARGRAEAPLAALTGPRLRCVMRRGRAPVPDEDHVYLHAAQLRFSGRPPQGGDRSWRAVGTHQDPSGGRNLGWHVPTFLAISADGRVSTLIRARTAQHADATESIMHGAYGASSLGVTLNAVRSETWGRSSVIAGVIGHACDPSPQAAGPAWTFLNSSAPAARRAPGHLAEFPR